MAIANQKSSVVCKFWLSGRCTRNPCQFSHQCLPSQQQLTASCGPGGPIRRKFTSRTRTTAPRQQKQHPITTKIFSKEEDGRVCKHWMSGTCIYGEECHHLHSWVSSKAKADIERVLQLKEHNKTMTGIAFSSGYEIMHTGSKDGTLRAWDVPTGECIGYINVGAEVGCLIYQWPWIFAGVPNAIWAGNTETSLRLSLEGPVGQVNALAVCQDTLFAACDDGNILAYNPCQEDKTFRQTATLRGHSKAVLSLEYSGSDNVYIQLFSGSADCTIRCWDPNTFQCTHVLEGHSGAVTSLISWKSFLLSGSTCVYGDD
ncbi:hypothetical protein QQ045_028750 [Rhodiola kirilowii]